MAVRGILFDKDGTLIDFRATCSRLSRSRRRSGRPCRAAAAFADVSWRAAAMTRRATAFSRRARSLGDQCGDRRGMGRGPELSGFAGAAPLSSAHFDDHGRYPLVPVGDLPALFDRLEASGSAFGLATMDTRPPRRGGARPDYGLAGRLDFRRRRRWRVRREAGTRHGPWLLRSPRPRSGPRVMVIGDTAADLLMARAAGAAMAVASSPARHPARDPGRLAGPGAGERVGGRKRASK
jgi:phosphoglycolate phosphatase